MEQYEDYHELKSQIEILQEEVQKLREVIEAICPLIGVSVDLDAPTPKEGIYAVEGNGLVEEFRKARQLRHAHTK